MPAPSGALETVDSAELQQLTDGYDAALTMVADLNTRIGNWAKWARCERIRLATGKTANGC